MSVNDITGDKLISKAANEKYRSNYDAIFKKCKKQFPCELKGDTINECKCKGDNNVQDKV